MTTTEADIAEAFLRRWNAERLDGQIRGGLWYGRVPPDAGPPYASISVRKSGTEYFSRGSLVTFEVEMSLWSDQSIGGEPRILTAAILTAFDTRQRPMIVSPGRVIRVRAGEGDLHLEESLRNAADVCQGRMTWRILIQET
ncbi:hypothetical protein [Tuwongella immobilis]|uniref:Uncharacterized protein n=1 Tax=Tuwongella immobilis TaxID=692036 RepID=A0A6C2YN79_9BACT|nr:hypothetical protein [Tuwongella immobilis]VIP03068.1 unnamed protein product [Tuwongella immobilis]VTS03291.1 unnamed protein product [Tuwongella immobilis]